MKSVAVLAALLAVTSACGPSHSDGSLLDSTAATSVPFSIVSDIDDTVKITNVQDTSEAVWNGLFGKEVFPGMESLYNTLLKSEADQLPAGSITAGDMVFVSGSPSILRNKLTDLLFVGHHFPAGRIVLKPNFTSTSTQSYKQAEFAKLASSSSRNFLLLGDDTEKDPEAMTAFSATQGAQGRILAKYVRVVTGRALPAGVQPFHTAFDVAMMEYHAGRLSSDVSVAIGAELLSIAQQRFGSLFPDYVDCPTSYDSRLTETDPTALKNMEKLLGDVITEKCRTR